MKNEKWYKETFEKVHVPEELLGKVMDMENQMDKKVKRRWRYAVGTLAAAFGLFVASNGICFAAIGETWVSKITIYSSNGEKIERDITWQENEDGTLHGTVGTGGDAEIHLYAIADNVEIAQDSLSYSINGGDITEGVDEPYAITVGEDDAYEIIDCKVETDKDGSVWLRVIENDACVAEVDLTADLADGMAEGDFTYDGLIYHYLVTQDVDGEYELMFSAKIGEE